MTDQVIDDLWENDTQVTLPCTYDGVDVSAFQALELHIKYKPYPLVIDAALDASDLDGESFIFSFAKRVSGVLTAAASAGDTSITVDVTGDGDVFADLPDSGELLIGSEHVLYSSKTAPDILTLASALTEDHASGDAFEKLPDLRAGTWKAEVELYDSLNKNITFGRLVLKIEDEIA